MVIRAFGAIAAGVPFLLVPFLLVYGLDRVWVTPLTINAIASGLRTTG
jgi:hypothetical protein